MESWGRPPQPFQCGKWWPEGRGRVPQGHVLAGHWLALVCLLSCWSYSVLPFLCNFPQNFCCQVLSPPSLALLGTTEPEGQLQANCCWLRTLSRAEGDAHHPCPSGCLPLSSHQTQARTSHGRGLHHLTRTAVGYRERGSAESPREPQAYLCSSAAMTGGHRKPYNSWASWNWIQRN